MHIRMTASPSHYYSSSDSTSKYTEDCTNLCEDFITTAKLARKSREQKAVIIAPLFPPELTTHDGAKSGNQLTECRAIHRWWLYKLSGTYRRFETHQNDRLGGTAERRGSTFWLTEALYTPLNTARLAAKPPPDLGEQMESEGEKS